MLGGLGCFWWRSELSHVVEVQKKLDCSRFVFVNQLLLGLHGWGCT